MKVLVSDKIANEGLEILRRSGGEVDVKTGLKPEEIVPIIGDYDAMVVRSQTRVTAEVINAGKKLKVIGRAGAGVDTIDVEEATKNGILVVNAPTSNTVAVAEHTIGLMLSLTRHIPKANASLKSGEWKRGDFMGTEVRGKTLGLIGLGNVGSEVAKRAQAFNMKVIAYSPSVPPERARKLGVELVSLEQLLKASDFISLHTKMSPEKKGMIGEKELALVKPTVRIINCARGALINEEALCKALKEGRIAGAAIDVFCTEPCTESALFACDNAIVTPHLGASTHEAQVVAATDTAEQIVDVLQGKPAKHPVNTPTNPR